MRRDLRHKGSSVGCHSSMAIHRLTPDDCALDESHEYVPISPLTDWFFDLSFTQAV